MEVVGCASRNMQAASLKMGPVMVFIFMTYCNPEQNV